ncbi:hypothetical protein M2390_000296 [Mycetocola sp. BIGb0189]|uniref:hypothetical protein n=1 Tax=Mycetocola sp. BIGb0189 TaxID=2940604 RepID=UPI002167ABF2|nr:hypothetical protein [Mycetocola sp. BIGb0189]MCS4275138.1 hypothetical protein [Mycetocola sp. BIGb0189]
MVLLPSGLLAPALISTLGSHAKAFRYVELGNAGSDPQTPVLMLLNLDDSGSLAAGNDPVGARYEEAKRALRHIAAASLTDLQQVAVFRFDHPKITPVGPLPLNDGPSVGKLLSAVEPPAEAMGSSSLTPSMMAMNRLAEQHPGIDRVAVIFSDFELFDQQPTQPYEEIARFPGSVHAVVLGNPPPAPLLALPNVEVTQVSPSDPPGMLAAVLTHSLTRFRGGATRATIRAGTPHSP